MFIPRGSTQTFILIQQAASSEGAQLSYRSALVHGGVTALAAELLAYPFQVLRSRMHVHGKWANIYIRSLHILTQRKFRRWFQLMNVLFDVLFDKLVDLLQMCTNSPR